jgi:two-component system, NarL family, response regulator NreC
MHVKVLMIDDHPPITEGYKAILSQISDRYTIDVTMAFTAKNGYEIISTIHDFQLIYIDFTLPVYEEKGIHSGQDLIPFIRKYCPLAKVLVATSHSESLLLYNLINDFKPDGVMIKSDVKSEDFIEAFEIIINDGNYYSRSIVELQKEWEKKSKILDSYNRQILLLLAEGAKTKSLPEILHLSQSAIDKRKATIKMIFGIEKGNDEDILREARKQGLV